MTAGAGPRTGRSPDSRNAAESLAQARSPGGGEITSWPVTDPATIDRALGTREVGARLASGPWQALPRGRWAVPAVAYLSLVPLGELVVRLEAGRVVVERGTGSTAAGVMAPEDEVIFTAKRGGKRR